MSREEEDEGEGLQVGGKVIERQTMRNSSYEIDEGKGR